MPGLKHRYEPSAAIAMEPHRREDLLDYYTGTREELVAAGVAPANLFPGEPGMPLARVNLYPNDAKNGDSWWIPGRLSINRLPSGKFTAAVVVSAVEQQRRTEVSQQERRELIAEGERLLALRVAETEAGASLEQIVVRLGEHAVRRRLRELAGAGGRRPPVAHLRLVWSAT